MKLKDFLKKQLKQPYILGPKSDVVVSSRVRLARNIESKPFPWRASHTALERIWIKAKELVSKIDEFSDSESLYLSDLNATDRELLIERHLTSYNHAISKKPRGVIFTNNERLSIMINEEDHVRLAAVHPGLDLALAAQAVDAIDSKLAHNLNFAYSNEWGFLTSCPTNAGTGMRVSCLVHLPALVITEKLEPMLSELYKLGIVVRGLYGEHTEVLGDIFQIANGSTMGHTESEILQSIEHVIVGIISYEKHARQELIGARYRLFTEDKVYRAKAILLNARSISFHEAMELLSKVKLGICLNMEIPWSHETLNKLMVLIQPAHLKTLIGKELSSEELDIVRARIIRQKLT